MTLITLPNKWSPRPYQLPVLQYFDGGGKRAASIWARRHGKDSTAINFTAKSTFERVGLYWHILPTLRQARKAIWNGIDRDGRRIIDQAFPEPLRKRTRDDEMLIELANGSIWQAVGGDNYDALVGSNPVGVVLSEWSLMDPKVWEFIRPILMENDGWAWFIYTPRGRNHGHALYEMAKNNPLWHSEVITIADAGHLPLSVIDEERAAGMPEELIQQEYFCSFDVGLVGTIFAKEIDRAQAEGRITDIPYDANWPVETAWDLGVGDSTVIWFIQRVGPQIRVIDYYENKGHGLPHYASLIHSKPYAYARHVGPHDLAQRGWESGESRKVIAERHGINFDIAPKLLVEDGINAARGLLSRTYFNKSAVEKGLEALRNYRYEYDEETRVFKPKPLHDWASHAADAFRTYAVMPELDYIMPNWVKKVMDQRRYGRKGMEDVSVQSQELADPLGMFR